MESCSLFHSSVYLEHRWSDWESKHFWKSFCNDDRCQLSHVAFREMLYDSSCEVFRTVAETATVCLSVAWLPNHPGCMGRKTVGELLFHQPSSGVRAFIGQWGLSVPTGHRFDHLDTGKQKRERVAIWILEETHHSQKGEKKSIFLGSLQHRCGADGKQGPAGQGLTDAACSSSPTFVQGGEFQGDADDSNQVLCGDQGTEDGPSPDGLPFSCLDELSCRREKTGDVLTPHSTPPPSLWQ
jgi:hypothetical protein